jgi:hypothetical protein
MPASPVSIEYRRALLGPGLVLLFYNNAGRPLQLLVTLTHPAINVTRQFALFIGAPIDMSMSATTCIT